MTLWLNAVDPDLVTVNDSVPPSETDVLLIEKFGPPSSLLIVPTPWLSLIVAPPVAALRLTLTVSLLS